MSPVGHGRRRRPAVEVAFGQPRVERRGHRHRHARRVVMGQALRRRGRRAGSAPSRPTRLRLPDELGDRVRIVDLRRLRLSGSLFSRSSALAISSGFGFSGCGSFGRSGGGSARSRPASAAARLRLRRRRRRLRFGRRRGLGLGGGGAGARLLGRAQVRRRLGRLRAGRWLGRAAAARARAWRPSRRS